MPENQSKTNGDKKYGIRLKSRVKKPIVTVRKWEDVKKVEEVEDCFILEFDPTKIINNDDDNISGGVVCVKKREDVKKVEELEDCFILEFDPCQDYSSSVDVKFSKLCVSVKTEVFSDDDDDVTILSVKGQVACRDYPHPRHLCGTYPFKKTFHEIYCKMCYCYVCDKSAPCKKWSTGHSDPTSNHCDATPDSMLWKLLRDQKKQQREHG